MKNFEFISYKQYSDDPYTQAIARVRIDRKHVVIFAQKKTKNGGLFWSAPSISVTENGEKKYLTGYKLDSEVENEMLVEFIEANAKRASQGQSVFSQAPEMPPMSPTSMDEVANQQQLPF